MENTKNSPKTTRRNKKTWSCLAFDRPPLRTIFQNLLFILVSLIPSTLQENLISFSRKTLIDPNARLYSGISHGETITFGTKNTVLTYNTLERQSVFHRVNLPQSSNQYSLHLSKIFPYLLAADLDGNVYVMNYLRNLTVLKRMKLDAFGRSYFFRSQIHAFENTNYFFLASRSIYKTGSHFHDWTKDISESKHLTSEGHIVKFSSFERVSLILSIEEFFGKKIMKIDPTKNETSLGSYTHTEGINSMIHLNKIGNSLSMHHITIIVQPSDTKVAIYNSASNLFTNEILIDKFNKTVDMVIIKGTDSVAFSTYNPQVFFLIKIPSMTVWKFDYPNSDKYEIKQIIQIEETDYLWLGIDTEFSLYTINPSLCHRSCSSCTRGALNNSCDSCFSDNVLKDGYCLTADNLCQTTEEPYYFPELSTCGTECGVGFFLEPGNVCRSCVDGCDVCQNKLDCETCEKSFEINDFGLCIKSCKVGEFKKEEEGCESCHSSCYECEGPLKTDCTTCKKFEKSSPDGTCSFECEAGKYFNYSLGECLSCQSPCTTCNNGTTDSCLTCDENYYEKLNPSNPEIVECLKDCPNGYYDHLVDSVKTCSKCSENCDNCYQTQEESGSYQIVCSTCSQGYHGYRNICFDECPEGTRNETQGLASFCRDCPDNCAQCHIPPNASSILDVECLNCQSDFFLNFGQCSDSCSNGFFKNEDINPKTCSACPQNCKVCLDSTSCNWCDFGYSLNSSKLCQTLDNGGGEPEPDTPGNIVFLLGFLVITIMLLMLFVMIHKKTMRERQERLQMERRRRRLRAMTPMAEPYHPVVLEGETDPLRPRSSLVDKVKQEQVHFTEPYQPTSSAFNPKSYLEIDIMVEDHMKDLVVMNQRGGVNSLSGKMKGKFFKKINFFF